MFSKGRLITTDATEESDCNVPVQPWVLSPGRPNEILGFPSSGKYDQTMGLRRRANE